MLETSRAQPYGSRILYIAPGRNWVDNDLTALAGAVTPAAGSALDGFWGTDGSQHVNFIGTDNHIHELYIAPGAGWVENDLTALAGAVAPAAGSALDGYWGSDSSQHVNFIGTDNHVHELYIAPAPAGSTTTSRHSRSPEPLRNSSSGVSRISFSRARQVGRAALGGPGHHAARAAASQASRTAAHRRIMTAAAEVLQY